MQRGKMKAWGCGVDNKPSRAASGQRTSPELPRCRPQAEATGLSCTSVVMYGFEQEPTPLSLLALLWKTPPKDTQLICAPQMTQTVPKPELPPFSSHPKATDTTSISCRPAWHGPPCPGNLKATARMQSPRCEPCLSAHVHG